MVSPSQTLNLFTALKGKGVDAKRVVLTGAGHGDMTVTEAIAQSSPSASSGTGTGIASADGSSGERPWSTKKTMSYITDFLAGHRG